MDDDAAFFITCGPDVGDQLRSVVHIEGVDVEGAQRRGLDGTQAASWMVVATVAIKSAPTFLQALKEFLTRNQVSAITVGSTTIQNPRPVDVDRLLAAAEAEAASGS